VPQVTRASNHASAGVDKPTLPPVRGVREKSEFVLLFSERSYEGSSSDSHRTASAMVHADTLGIDAVLACCSGPIFGSRNGRQAGNAFVLSRVQHHARLLYGGTENCSPESRRQAGGYPMDGIDRPGKVLRYQRKEDVKERQGVWRDLG